MIGTMHKIHRSTECSLDSFIEGRERGLSGQYYWSCLEWRERRRSDVISLLFRREVAKRLCLANMFHMGSFPVEEVDLEKAKST